MRILLLSTIDKGAQRHLEREYDVVAVPNADREQLMAAIADREVVILRSGVELTRGAMACAPGLKLILRAGSGVDNIDVEYAESRNIPLVRIPGPGAKAVAELAFALMLGVARNVAKADRQLRQGRWLKSRLTGYLLTEKTLGVVGAGNIGSRVGELGAAWGMKVLGCVETRTAEKEARLKEKGIELTTFERVLEESDYVSVHVPRKKSTLNLIDGRALARMKPEAVLANLARGGVVDESALLEALENQRLRGAALDVHEREGKGVSPLAHLDNVVLTPHIGAGTFDSQREIGEIIKRTLADFRSR